MQDVILPDGSVFRFDDASQTWRHVPDVATANAIGVDFNNLQAVDQVPGTIGPEWPSVESSPSSPPPPPSSSAPPPSSSAPPPGSSSATSFVWGAKTWQQGDLPAFIGYLAAHGVSYETWAANHPAAAAIIEGPPVDPSREPVPKSLGEALQAYIAGGSSAAEAAKQAEALRAALVEQGVSNVTPAQLLADAQVVKQTFDQEQGTPPPAGEPSVGGGPVVTPPVLPSRDPNLRELADASSLPVIPAGFATIVDGKVTEAFVISAALIEHADPWIVLGTCQVESGFNLEERMNSAGAVGPMQEVGYPPYSSSVSLEQWAWGNLIAGARLLARYAAVYDSDQPKMSAAYNAGAGAVNLHWPSVLSWLEVAGHPEDGTVQDYVDNVARAAGDYRASFAAGWNIDAKTGKLINGKGPVVTPPVLPTPSSTPTGVNTAWQKLVGTLAVSSPKTRDQLRSESDQLVEIFK